VADMTVVPLTRMSSAYAIAAMEQGPLRGMDALHVGSALASRVDLFVTADRRQAQVARGMGLATELIENRTERPESWICFTRKNLT
jgi:predicted nucleic acid-binding protein